MERIFDLHCDTLTALLTDRLENTLDNPRSAFALSRIPPNIRWAQCCAVFLPDALPEEQVWPFFLRWADSFRRQGAAFSSRARLCASGAGVEAAWRAEKTALLLTVENGSVLGRDLERVEALAQAGVVMMSLTWNGKNAIAAGAGAEGGLTDFGRAAAAALEARGIVPDVSHLNRESFWDLMEAAEGPVAASHSNAAALCPHPRNLTGPQAREIARRGGLVGLNFYPPFLRPGGRTADWEDVYRHAACFLELGLEDCLALGSDFDGAELPPDLDGCEKIPALGDFLAQRLGRELAEKICWKNALAFFQRISQERSGRRGAGTSGISGGVPGKQPH